MKIARIAVAPALAIAIALGGFAADASANAKGDTAVMGCEWGVAEGPAVVITGGSVSNTTDINISANAGSAVSDASGGNNNLGTAGGGGDFGVETAVVGGGGAANAGANGGAISLGDVNSGANSGNAITVGNTTNCAPAPEAKPEKPGKVYEEVAPEVVAEAPAMVVALPATGVGGVDAGLLSMIAAAGAAGAAGLGLRRRG